MEMISFYLWGIEDRVDMAREGFRELTETGSMCGGFKMMVVRKGKIIQKSKYLNSFFSNLFRNDIEMHFKCKSIKQIVN